jgi:hypothetical protein
MSRDRVSETAIELVFAGFVLLLSGCNNDAPHFELRGVASKSNKESYGTSYHVTGTVIGSGSAATKPYLVWYATKRTGGNPELPVEGMTTVLVKGGIGDLDVYLGLRSNDETWSAPALELIPLGYTAITPFK